METRMYGAGERKAKTKFILESLELGYHHKEKINMENLTIEHVMPQTLSVWWQNNLGEDWENVHDELLDNIGNLTLTAYNSELSNDDFDTKRSIYAESHLELNKYFSRIDVWNREQIVERSSILTKKALEVWPYFGEHEETKPEEKSVSGTNPYSVEILGETFKVKTWRDVFELTLNTISELAPEKFDQIADNLSKYIGKDKNKFRAIRQLSNGYFIEVNMSASLILKVCKQVIEMADLTIDDWIVSYKSDDDTSTHVVSEGKPNSSNERSSNSIKTSCVDRITNHFGINLDKISNSVYKTKDKSMGFYFAISKAYEQPHYEHYWFSYRKKEELFDCRTCYYVFGCKDENTLIVMTQNEIEAHLSEMNSSNNNETGEIGHWHVVFNIGADKHVKWSLSKPEMHEIDITDRLLH